MQYDSIGRASRTIGPLHDTTITTYDSLYVTQVRDAKGQVYKTWPNALGWADSTTDPAGAVDRFLYDSAGNRSSWINRRTQTIQFTYDSLNQTRFVIMGTDTTTFFSDPLAHFSAVSNHESTDTVKLDVAGRPILEISCRVLPGSGSARCFRDSSAYQIRDLRTALVASADAIWGVGVQRAVRWHYNNASNLDTLTNYAAQQTRFGYNSEFLMSGITLDGLNGMLMSQEFPWTHITSIVALSDSASQAHLGRSYSLDAGGRIETRFHGSLLQPDWTRSYTYDASDQLTGFADTTRTYAPGGGCTRHMQGEQCSGYQTSTGTGSGAFFYDSVGNRKDSSSATGGVDPGNRLRRLKHFRMDYDAAGNLTAKRILKTSDTTQVLRRDSLFWSPLGSLDSVHTRDSLGTLTRVGFGYDGWGRRVRKGVGSLTTRFLWDGQALLMDLDSAGNRVVEYTYYPGLDNPHSALRHDRGDTTFYYVKDLPGNVSGLVKRTATGVAVANEYAYTPFGELTTSSGPVGNRLAYAAREYDGETQLYYNRARYYDPSVGRFISEDPLGLRAGINLYSYASNDPLNGRDPSGLCAGSGGSTTGGSGDPDRKGPKKRSSGIACAVQAADAWFWMNYGFGLRDALSGTTGDCLFSVTNWACTANSSFSPPGAPFNVLNADFAGFRLIALGFKCSDKETWNFFGAATLRPSFGMPVMAFGVLILNPASPITPDGRRRYTGTLSAMAWNLETQVSGPVSGHIRCGTGVGVFDGDYHTFSGPIASAVR